MKYFFKASLKKENKMPKIFEILEEEDADAQCNDYKSLNIKKHSTFKGKKSRLVPRKYCDEKNFKHHLLFAKTKQEHLFYHGNSTRIKQEEDWLTDAVQQIHPLEKINQKKDFVIRVSCHGSSRIVSITLKIRIVVNE